MLVALVPTLYTVWTCLMLQPAYAVQSVKGAPQQEGGQQHLISAAHLPHGRCRTPRYFFAFLSKPGFVLAALSVPSALSPSPSCAAGLGGEVASLWPATPACSG